MVGNSAKDDDFFAEEQDFRRALISLSEAFRAKGVEVKPFHEKTWQDFRAFPLEKKQKVFRDFSRYYDIYMPVLLEPGSPNEDGKLLWAALKKLDLRPSQDFFSRIDESDIVEIYSPSGLQIFHNINFFEVCSYSFLEVFSYPFTELWIRNQVDMEDTQRVATEGFTGKIRCATDPRLPTQYLVEAFSELAYIIELKFRIFSPFYDDKGEVAALAAVSRCRVIDEEEYHRILVKNPGLPCLKPRIRIKLV